MNASKKVYSMKLGGKDLTVEIGEVAKQANAGVLVRYGDTVVLSTVTASKEAKDIDFFPLQVIYEERLYAVGKVPGGFIKREGRPSEQAILAGRLIDRPLRPLFPDGFRNEVQVVNVIMSVEHDCSPEIAAMLGSSLALTISDIPFDGPIAGARVGLIDGKYIINPSVEQLEKSDIDLVVAGTKHAINMVEAGAKEVPEASMLEAILVGHNNIKELVDFQEKIQSEIGKEKMELNLFTVEPKIEDEVNSLVKADLVKAVQIFDKLERYDRIDELKKQVVEKYEASEADASIIKQVKEVLDKIVKDEVRRLITEDKVRPDGRKTTEIRPLDSQLDILPRVHGSGMFTRGQTQVLSICTLGSISENQRLDGLETEDVKRFMHHYNFPQYSVGSTGRYGAPGRREIGHGALGERALRQVVPSEDEFPYTIRLVSEVLESNGSTSQASICASTLAMMAAGVPIKAPVAGIAMGLIMQGSHYSVLTDIQGMEDHLGDMDFKVAGTRKGVTALQMDIKIAGLGEEILREALEQAHIGRLHILDNMEATISEPRKVMSKYAPKIKVIKIDPDKIRDVIGPSGKQINDIIERSDDVKIDIEQDGRVFIMHQDMESIEKAIKIIEEITREAKVGEIYVGKVVRIEKFGAFVQLWEGVDGLVHVSQISHTRVEKVEDVLSLGDFVKVKVTEVDEKGRVNLSMKVLIPKE